MVQQIITGLFCTVVGGIILFIIIERYLRPSLLMSASPVKNARARRMIMQTAVSLFCTVVGGIILFIIIERYLRPSLFMPTAPEKNAGARPDTSAEPIDNSMDVPQITSVSIEQLHAIAITGKGFGTRTSYSGNSNFIKVSDLTKGWNAGSSRDFPPDKIILTVNSWTDNKIEISGFDGSYGVDDYYLNSGDSLSFQVWNAQSGAGPSVFKIVATQAGAGSEDTHPETPILETYQRVFADDFLFELQSCVLRGRNLTCNFTVTNDLDSDRTLGLLINWDSCSRIFDETGNEYVSESGQIGGQSGTPGISGFGHTLISGVKIKAALEFEGVPPRMKLVKLLRVMFDSPSGRMNHLNADFRDVPVQAR